MNLNNNREYCGILPVYKEKGYTSNDVVAKLRGILHMKKIGHTGTLDPDAEGVLPVCLGKGTKLVGMLTDTDKTYECTCFLGVTTDTEDLSGTVLSRNDISGITEDMVRGAAASFIGDYMQIPPMYSAKKVNGKKLYELARKGEVIERQPSHVFIRSVDIKWIDLESSSFSFTVGCSKGTYIRTLCSDMGKKLGCGAAMDELVRTRAGGFTLDDTLKLSEIEEIIRSGDDMDRYIRSIESMFSELPELTAVDDAEKRVLNGNIFSIDVPDGRYRVYVSDGRFAAVYMIRDKRAELCRFFLT